MNPSRPLPWPAPPGRLAGRPRLPNRALVSAMLGGLAGAAVLGAVVVLLSHARPSSCFPEELCGGPALTVGRPWKSDLGLQTEYEPDRWSLIVGGGRDLQIRHIHRGVLFSGRHGFALVPSRCSEHQELDVPLVLARLPVPRMRRTRKYKNANSMDLLPVEESACYRYPEPTNRGF